MGIGRLCPGAWPNYAWGDGMEAQGFMGRLWHTGTVLLDSNGKVN
jgi:hypothetical protein